MSNSKTTETTPSSSRRARLKKSFQEFEAEFFKTIATMIGSAFALVAALAWNSAIQSLIERYVAPGNSLRSQLIYALVVTLLAVIVTWQFGKIAGRFAARKVSEEFKEKNDKGKG